MEIGEEVTIMFPESGLDRMAAEERVIDLMMLGPSCLPGMNQAAMIVGEMTKNVLDHGGGKGGVTLKFDGQRMHFEVWDYGNGFDWEECRQSGFSTKPTGRDQPNLGLGVMLIHECLGMYHITVENKPGQGVRYAGSYNPDDPIPEPQP